LELIELGGEANAKKRLGVLRAIDKLDRLGEAAVRQLLGGGRTDDSGDFTPGAGLTAEQADTVLGLVTQAAPHAGPLLGKNNATLAAGKARLAAIEDLVRASGFAEDRIRIEPSVVRGLEYYTGPVFEAELSFEVKNEDGQSVRFGSVGGGGRYDGLVERF